MCSVCMYGNALCGVVCTVPLRTSHVCLTPKTDRGRSARNCHRPLVALSGVVCPAPLRTSHVCPTPILTVVDQRGIVTGSQKPWFHVITAALCKLGEEQSES